MLVSVLFFVQSFPVDVSIRDNYLRQFLHWTANRLRNLSNSGENGCIAGK